MKKILAIFLLLSSFIFGNEFIDEESSAFGAPAQKQFANPERNYVASKNLYLTYLNYPNHVYKNQRFEVEIKALITRKDYDYIQTRFLNGKNMSPLNPKESWKKSENQDTFTNKFFFKAYENNFKMPNIEVRLFKNKTLIESRMIVGKNVSFSEIAKSDERFTNVIARDFKVINSKIETIYK